MIRTDTLIAIADQGVYTLSQAMLQTSYSSFFDAKFDNEETPETAKWIQSAF